MQILRNNKIIDLLKEKNKNIYFWGCSISTMKFIEDIKPYNLEVSGIFDNSLTTDNEYFLKYEVLKSEDLVSVHNSIIIITGNHCFSLFNQFKTIELNQNTEIIFDYDNGADKLIKGKELYLNIDLEDIDQLKKNLLNDYELKIYPEIQKKYNGGNVLINSFHAEKIFSKESVDKLKINYINKYININNVYIGCGEDYREGYLHCDKRDLSHVDIVCNAWDIDKKISNLSTIYSRHMLEHLTDKEAMLTLRNWFKSLKKGGYLELIVPNFDLRAKQWLDCTWEEETYPTSDEIWSFAGCWGWQRECNPLDDNYNQSYWDVHKSGYNEKRISLLLKKIGFCEIKTNVDEKNNLIAFGYKK